MDNNTDILGLIVFMIAQRIEEFKSIVANKTNNIDDIIEEHIIFGTPYIFKDKPSEHYALIKQISSFFNVNQRNVFIVGSAKLGFSISPNKLWRHVDWNEDEDSDIDVVVISDLIFDKYWKDILEYNTGISMQINDDIHKQFLDYLFRGWLRPDKFPYNYEGKKEWFEFFRGISYKPEYGNRKIAVAIYREDYFFYRYHRENLNNIRINLNIGR